MGLSRALEFAIALRPHIIVSVLCLASCDQLFGIDEVGLEPDAGIDAAGPDAPAPPECLREDFSGLDIDRVAWALYDELKDPVDIAQIGGELVIALAPDRADTSNGVTSRGHYDVTDGWFEIELVQAVTGANSESGFDVAVDGGNYDLMTVRNNALILQVTRGGLKSNQSVPYNATNHRFARIRHVSSSGMSLFETSPDRATWTTLRMTTALTLTSVSFDVYAGTYVAGDANPGTARFDNARMITARCP